MALVYVIQNKKNGKCYIGQTGKPFKWRLSGHIYSRSLIGNAIRKYGLPNFSIFLNEVPEQFLDNLECNLIQIYNSLAPKGYNLESGGNKNKHFSEELLLKMSRLRKGRPSPNKGKIGHLHTEEWKQARSRALIGKPSARQDYHPTEETRKKLSIALKGKPWTEKRRKASRGVHNG